jgi:uncharacterized membrane protein YdjX (TVP38/TMEM64 family)
MVSPPPTTFADAEAAARRRLLLGLLALAVVVVTARLLGGDRLLGPLAAAARGHGVRGALLLALAYAPAALLGLPVAPLTMAAGAAYGPWLGAALSVPAGALSALLPFLLGRRFAARHPAALAHGTGRIARAARALGRGGFRLVLVLRLSWVAPFGILNYAFGASPCRLGDFLLGSLAGNAPVALGYAFAGALLMGPGR